MSEEIEHVVVLKGPVPDLRRVAHQLEEAGIASEILCPDPQAAGG